MLAGAIAALKLQRFEFAVQDASAALFFNPQYAKAYATRAAAHVELERCVHTKPGHKPPARDLKHLERWPLAFLPSSLG